MTKNPYEYLYIYYFEGSPDPDTVLAALPGYLGTWEDDGVSFLFFSQPCRRDIDRIAQKSRHARLVDVYEMTGEQWHGDKIEPYTIETLNICPPWQRCGREAMDQKQVVLDPGVVFGTGRHQTTEDCLFLIHRLCTRESFSTMLDIGTGTGLLSLGAAALGCRRVLACDFNYLAVKTALNNIRLNRFENRVLAFQARGEEIVSLDADLLVANIHYDVMQHIVDSPGLYGKKWIILSGLLNSEAKRVVDTLRARHFHIAERRCPDGVWNTILATPG